jgi:hypothetical protein
MPAGFVLKIDVGERVAVGVVDDEAVPAQLLIRSSTHQGGGKRHLRHCDMVCRAANPSGRLRRRASIRFVACGSRSYRLDLCSKLSEVLQQLVCCGARQHQSGSHYAMRLSGTASGRLVKSHTCERHCYVAMNRTNAYDFGCEYFPFVERIF